MPFDFAAFSLFICHLVGHFAILHFRPGFRRFVGFVYFTFASYRRLRSGFAGASAFAPGYFDALGIIAQYLLLAFILQAVFRAVILLYSRPGFRHCWRCYYSAGRSGSPGRGLPGWHSAPGFIRPGISPGWHLFAGTDLVLLFHFGPDAMAPPAFWAGFAHFHFRSR